MRTTQLANVIAHAAKPSAAGRLAAVLAGVRAWQPIKVPTLGIDAALILVGTARQVEIEAEVTRLMDSRGLEQSMLTLTPWELERSVRLIAEAVVELDIEKRGDAPPLGTVDDWGHLPPATIVELRRMYDDFSELHDPVHDELDDAALREIEDAFKKKDSTRLRGFGARRLSLWLLSTDALRADFSDTKSSLGGSAPDSSP